ncbi:MAG: hypothetical protein K9M02_08740 [Thiohalocapsa sp.]|nr:hypothetical protein [Thiohalocapsa sp.]
MFDIFGKLIGGSVKDGLTHHDYNGSTQRLRDDYDSPSAYAALCALSDTRGARKAATTIPCYDALPFGASLAALRGVAGRPQQQVAYPNQVAQAILVYRYRIQDYKCRLEAHCGSDGVFYVQRLYRHLSTAQHEALLKIIKNKYHRGEAIDFSTEKLVDDAGNEVLVTDDVSLSIHYIGRGTPALRGLQADMSAA